MLSAWLLLATDASDQAAADAARLPVRGLAALVLLVNRPGQSSEWLSGRLSLTQSGAVRLVDRLQDLGLLRRQRVAGRREVALYVTRSGQARLRRGLRAREAAMAALVEPLSAAEHEQLTALVGKLLAGASRLREEADVACRLCDWELCKPECPVDASVVDDPPGP